MYLVVIMNVILASKAMDIIAINIRNSVFLCKASASLFAKNNVIYANKTFHHEFYKVDEHTNLKKLD